MVSNTSHPPNHPPTRSHIPTPNKHTQSIQEMVSLLEEFANSERQLLIIAEEIKGDALDALLMNKERGSLKVRTGGGFGRLRLSFFFIL